MPLRLPGPHAPTWVFAESAGSALFSFAAMLAVGRVIGPQDAGAGTVAIAAFLLLDVLGATLFSDALVQRPSLSRRCAESAATTAVILALGLGFALAVAAPVLSVGTGEPVVLWLTLALAPLLPLSAYAGTAAGLLLRGRWFRTLALRLLLGQPLALLAGLGLGLAGCGPWAMVGSQAVATVVTAALVWRGSGLRLTRQPDLQALRELWPVALPQVAGIAVMVGRYRLFLLVLGLLLPHAVVALSHFAVRLIEAASTVVWHVTGRLALPRLCALAQDPAALAAAYGEIVQLQALIGLPLAGGLALVAPDLVQVLLGPAWAATANAAQVAALATMASFLYGDQISLFVAVGRARLNLFFALALLALPLLGLVILRPESAAAAALAWSGPAVLAAPVLAWAVLTILQRSPWWLLGKLLPGLAASLAMALAVIAVQAVVPGPLTRLLVAILAGAAAFTLVAWLMLAGRLPAALRDAVPISLPR